MNKQISTGVGIAIIAIVAGAIWLFVWSSQVSQTQPAAQNMPTAPQSSLKGQVGNQNVAQNVGQTQPTVQNIETDKYKDWATYKNDVYKYQFRYPNGTKIIDVSATMTNGFDKTCLQINDKLGYIMIQALNKKFDYPCGRTGVAFKTKNIKGDTFTINGKSYVSSGMEEIGPGNIRSETLNFTLTDGTRIEYGGGIVGSDDKGTFADYIKIKPEILKIIESYQKI